MQDNLLLSIKKLSFGYSEGDFALDDVSIEVSKGDYVTAIGPNGGGKTTLVKLILGLLKPTLGSIRFNSLYIKSKKDIGYVPQLMLFDRSFPITVRELVLMGFIGKFSFFRTYPKKKIKSYVDYALDSMGMLSFRDRYISELSGGQMQRVLIARAIVSRPVVLILDEPTNFIDEKTRESFFHLVKEWNKDITILIVTHDLSVVSSFANKILCVNRKVYLHTDYEESCKTLQGFYGEPTHIVSHRLLDKHE